MRSAVAALAVAASLLQAGPTFAGDHLVPPESVQAALDTAAAARARDLATLDRALSSPAAVPAARALGADLRQVRSRLATLDDAELKDLAARASALGVDPAGGALSSDVNTLLIIFLIVAIVVLVLKIV